MNVPRPFAIMRRIQRFAFSRSTAGQKIGREITSAPSPTLVHYLFRVSRRLGGSRKWRHVFSKTLASWIFDEADHAATTSQLTSIEMAGRWIPEQLFAASRLTASLGLFEAALTFELKAYDLIRVPRREKASSGELIELMQVAIHRGDLGDATALCEVFRARNRPVEALPYSVRDLLHYILVWAGKPSDVLFQSKNSSSIEARWRETVSDRDVIIYGPGVVSPEHRNFDNSELIARIAGPGSVQWTDTGDLAQGRTDFVYLIPESLRAIGDTVEKQKQALGHYRFVCVKRSEAEGLDNARKVEAASRLFLRGHPNMVPLACIDLLRAPAARPYVVGSDFFASSTSYRQDSRRTTGDGTRQTPQGSNGNRFDRTTLFGSHNVFQNRKLVKNLVDAGRVKGDDDFLAVCALTDQQYANRLDFLYGRHKI